MSNEESLSLLMMPSRNWGMTPVLNEVGDLIHADGIIINLLCSAKIGILSNFAPLVSHYVIILLKFGFYHMGSNCNRCSSPFSNILSNKLNGGHWTKKRHIYFILEFFSVHKLWESTHTDLVRLYCLVQDSILLFTDHVNQSGSSESPTQKSRVKGLELHSPAKLFKKHETVSQWDCPIRWIMQSIND